MPQPICIHIPLTICKCGRRPRILPPKEAEVEMERGQDPHVLRAIGLAWRWRKLIERGDVARLSKACRAMTRRAAAIRGAMEAMAWSIQFAASAITTGETRQPRNLQGPRGSCDGRFDGPDTAEQILR